MTRKQWTAPLPPGAEITFVRGVRTARWRIRGGGLRTAEVIDGKDGTIRIRGVTAAYIARYKDAGGVTVEIQTGCRDETAARAVLAKLERRVELVKSGVITADEDAVSEHGQVSFTEHLEEFTKGLRLKGGSPHRISQVRSRLLRIARDAGIARLGDLTHPRVERWLSEQQDLGMSAGTRNVYRGDAIGFANWCRRSGRLLVNPLTDLPSADQRADRRLVRRALTEAELVRLLDAARRRPLVEALTIRRGESKGQLTAHVQPHVREQLERLGRERALIYKALLLTGLRKGELESLTVGQLILDADVPHLVLDAADEKNRRGSDIPLRADLAEDLRLWLDERLEQERLAAERNGAAIPARLASDAKLLNVPAGLIRIFDRDLVFAGLARMERRGGRDVIVKTDDRGRTLDVHALRVSFGTHLSRGGVPLRTAQAAMRHSDPSLTASVYTDPRLLDVAGALEALPRLDLAPRPAASARTAM